MENYYKILDITKDANLNDIKTMYTFKLSRYQDLPFLTDTMKNDIKQLEIAKYILFNEQRRKKYDIILNKDTKKDINNSTKISERLFSLKL